MTYYTTENDVTRYITVEDARITLAESGYLDKFRLADLGELSLNPRPLYDVSRWMFDNGATPQQAAEHFGAE